MILNSIDKNDTYRVSIMPLRDRFYAEDLWVKDVREYVDNELNKHHLTFPVLFGSNKDTSSYYLRYFDDYEMSLNSVPNLDATTVRTLFFAKDENDIDLLSEYIPEGVTLFMKSFRESEPDLYDSLSNEFAHIQDYKEMWSNTPFPVIFVTVDSVVLRDDKILVIKRKINPGKGKYAIPGGFIKPDELLSDAAVRELREETRIKLSPSILKSSIRDTKVFDHPGRSSRGRTITHAHYFDLSHVQDYINVSGGDDAAEAMWMNVSDFYKNEDQFFEDHAQIIEYFILSRDRILR